MEKYLNKETTMKEEWKQIPGFKDYEASNLGNIRSWKKQSKGKVLKPFISNCGYNLIHLLENNKRFTKAVHRIIILSFIGQSDLTVNHIDGNKTNNKISNLEYCTMKENLIHAYKSGLKNGDHKRGENNYKTFLSSDDVLLIRKLKKEYNIKQSTIATLFNASDACISEIITRKNWGHI
jgi:hypothetical protein